MNRPIVSSISDSSMQSDATDPSLLPFSDMDLDSDQDSRTNIHKQLEALADATLLVDQHSYPFLIPGPHHQSPNGSCIPYVLPALHTTLTAPDPCRTSNSQPQAPYYSPRPRHSCAFARALRDIHSLIAPLAQQLSHHSSQSTHSLLGPSNPTSSNPNQAHHSNTTGSSSSHPDFEKRVDAIRLRLGPLLLARRCFDAAGIGALLIDDTLDPPPGAVLAPIQHFSSALGVTVVRRILDVGRIASDVLMTLCDSDNGERGGGDTGSGDLARRFRQGIQSKIDPLPDGVVALKMGFGCGSGPFCECSDDELNTLISSICASRSSNSTIHAPSTNLGCDQRLLSAVLKIGMDLARQHRIPVQFPCGMHGGGVCGKRVCNPLILQPLLEQYSDVRVVLLRSAWPFAREAAYLAAAFPHVYLDLSLAAPPLSARGFARALDVVLDVAPTTKLMYSSHAHSAPDAFFLAAKWGRRAVARAMAMAVSAGDMGTTDAKVALRGILAENALRLYNLPSPNDF
eukprot:Plantae.Rhodophyta-Hildenbrandia_rubra.ctg12961.p1 GENE.Plantae.Rhodophyta-Hildenbrandia_rubra.ctg12961~~Plantae.Rhodophyta-Hildenbrandia_rubra.ctg12961.p1  ORF type:complete len:513 (-),score=63.96 Plantae.Rhodophyta-Hildenbrandia_rubra.ctg12961:2025-3563(-)